MATYGAGFTLTLFACRRQHFLGYLTFWFPLLFGGNHFVECVRESPDGTRCTLTVIPRKSNEKMA